MGIEWCRSKEKASRDGVDAAAAGARRTKTARIPVSINLTIDAASYREAPVGAMAHIFAGPAGFASGAA
jgi:hypothetical protein